MPAEKHSFGPDLFFFSCHRKGIADAPERQGSRVILRFLGLSSSSSFSTSVTIHNCKAFSLCFVEPLRRAPGVWRKHLRLPQTHLRYLHHCNHGVASQETSVFTAGSSTLQLNGVLCLQSSYSLQHLVISPLTLGLRCKSMHRELSHHHLVHRSHHSYQFSSQE